MNKTKKVKLAEESGKKHKVQMNKTKKVKLAEEESGKKRKMCYRSCSSFTKNECKHWRVRQTLILFNTPPSILQWYRKVKRQLFSRQII